MKKRYILIVLFFVIIITIVGSSIVTGNISVIEEKDILIVQKNNEVYFNGYGYSVENPNIILNPYGNSPLTALIMFETNDYSEVEVIIKSKNGNSDINYVFNKDKYHMIPIYGLYADYDNTVIIRSEGIEKKISIITEKLPDDFIYLRDVTWDNFMFYNSNYPYAVDCDGEVRWFLDAHYFGNISFIDNSIILGSDKYMEEGRTISFYKMNFLGKIYNEYLLPDDYYGYSSLYKDDILVLSDDILLIDIQTGEVIKKYHINEGFDYLCVDSDNIVVRKEDIFYKIIDDTIVEVAYDFSSSKHSFYTSTNNYDVVPSNRFGSLKETLVSDKKISLISYDDLKELEDIDIVKEVNRIRINNYGDDNLYLILDKFMDKRIYEVSDVKYINNDGLNGKYTVYLKINDKVYKTNYYIEV